MPEILDIVNLNDEVVSQATRDEVYEKSLCHRIVHVLIFNDDGKMALQKRSQTVSFCPGYWSTAVGGHVQTGETYVEGAFREFEEELNMIGALEFFSKDLYEAKGSPTKFVAAFKSRFNGSFQPNPNDVEMVDFFTMDEIKQMMREGEKFHPELLFLLEKYFI
ncbi:MAG: NUDIX domain-containing protein [Patescibacteria group bacterium]|nr:NUDIX domain-containing protein [Patescibacteria group bacterium]